MMGVAQRDINAPVTKGTSAILVLSGEHGEKKESACIRCGRCVRGCPIHLMPNYLAAYSSRDNFDMAEKFDALSCVECGSCSYVCPAGVPIVQYIRTAKAKINEKKCAQANAASDK